MDLFPLYNSLRISAIATILAFVTGIMAAYAVLRMPQKFKGICDTILTVPLVLPPTVVGYFVLIWLSPKSLAGGKLLAWFAITITMRWQAAVAAVTVIIFPLIYRTVRGSFEAFDHNLLDAGRTLGLSEKYIFARILLPGCKPGIIAAGVLAFARGLGEYGATSMVSGYIIGKTATISTSVAYFWQINQDQIAFRWVCVNLAVSFIFMILVNAFSRPQKKG